MAVITPFDPWGSPLCTCPPKYSFSAYTGCGHACRYCYIRAYIPHAFRCRAKKDIIKRLRRDLRRIDPKLHVSIANSSDPYTPPESSLQLTRKALQILLSGGFKVQLITKSDLIVRDLDLIRKGNCSVSMSITTLDNIVARKLEPNAPPPSKRLKATGKLVKEGVPCSIRIDPIIPKVTDMNFEKLVEAIAKTGASHIVASTYKAKTDSFKGVTAAFPEYKKELIEYYWTEGKRIQRAQYLPEKMRREILTHVKRIVEEFNMTYATCREGMIELQSGEECDGSHLIPIRCKKSWFKLAIDRGADAREDRGRARTSQHSFFVLSKPKNQSKSLTTEILTPNNTEYLSWQVCQKYEVEASVDDDRVF